MESVFQSTLSVKLTTQQELVQAAIQDTLSLLEIVVFLKVKILIAKPGTLILNAQYAIVVFI